ncbi:cytochrome P450 [Haematococcus lacustris]
MLLLASAVALGLALAVPGAIAARWLLVLLAIPGLGWLWERQRRSALLDLRKIPGPWTTGLPLFGNMFQVMRLDYHRLLLQWANQFGGIYRVRALWIDSVVVTDPKLLATICGRGPGALEKASIMYTPINQMCSVAGHPNLVSAKTDPAWRAVRKAVATSLSLQNIKKKYPVMQGCVEKMVHQLAELSDACAATGNPPLIVDVDQMAARVTLDVIGLTGFGKDLHSLDQGADCVQPAPDDHLLRILPRCFAEVISRVINPLRAVFPGKFHSGKKGEVAFSMFRTKMRELLYDCLARPEPPSPDDLSIGAQLWRLYHEQVPAPPPMQLLPPLPKGTAPVPGSEWDLRAGGVLPPPPSAFKRLRCRLHELLGMVTSAASSHYTEYTEQVGKDGKVIKVPLLLSAERLLSDLGIVFVAGFETTGHTISWTLLHIATTPGVQEKIAAELDSLGLLVHPPKPCKATTSPSPASSTPRVLTPEPCAPSPLRASKASSLAGPDDFDGFVRRDNAEVLASGKVLRQLTPVFNTDSAAPPYPIFPDPTAPCPALCPAAADEPLEFEPSQVDAGSEVDSMPKTLPEPNPIENEPGAVSGAAWLPPRSIDLDDLPRMRYLNAVIKESMRVLPVVTLIGKTCGDKPLQLGPYKLPAHTPIGVPLFAIHNSDANWERPTEFIPERWDKVPVESFVVGQMPPLGASEGCDKDSAASTAAKAAGERSEVRFMPFSDGPRSCVGQTLGRIEVAAVLAALLGTFRVELAPEMGGREAIQAREATMITLQLRGAMGMRMVLHPRWLP